MCPVEPRAFKPRAHGKVPKLARSVPLFAPPPVMIAGANIADAMVALLTILFAIVHEAIVALATCYNLLQLSAWHRVALCYHSIVVM